MTGIVDVLTEEDLGSEHRNLHRALTKAKPGQAVATPNALVAAWPNGEDGRQRYSVLSLRSGRVTDDLPFYFAIRAVNAIERHGRPTTRSARA